MNYQKHYNQLIESRKEKTSFSDISYWEKHHVIPKCMNGSDDDSNLVLLTAKEHYIAHLLLVKIYPKNEKLKHAFVAMSKTHKDNRRLTAKQHEKATLMFIKELLPAMQKNRIFTEEQRAKISEANRNRSPEIKAKLTTKGYKFSEYSKEKISNSHKGKILSEETKKKISEAGKGKTFTDEQKAKLRESNLGKKRSEKAKEAMKKGWEKRKINSPMTQETKEKWLEANKGKKREGKALEAIQLGNQKRKLKNIWIKYEYLMESI